MGKKRKIIIEVEEGQEVTIKPLGETQAEILSDNDASISATKVATTTTKPGGIDVDVGIDW